MTMQRPIEFRRCEFPPTLALIAEVERVAGCTLPMELRNHFMDHNGGDPSRSTITMDGNPVHKHHPYLVLSFCELHPGMVSRPPGCEYQVITIAYSSNDEFCYVLGPSDRGSIVHCLRKRYENTRYIRSVSHSFEEFLDSLETDPTEGWNRHSGWATLKPEEKTYVDFVPYLPDAATLERRRGPAVTRPLNFVDCQPPVTDEHFAWMEQGFHIRIPLDIREHFQRFNGGQPAQNLHYRSEGQMCQFNNFYHMQYRGPSDKGGEMPDLGTFENRCFDLKWREKFIPAHLFPIAIAYDELCFSCREEDFGSIWRWVHNIYERGYKKLADSFNEFLNMLEVAR